MEKVTETDAQRASWAKFRMKVTYKCVDVGMISAVEAREIVLN